MNPLAELFRRLSWRQRITLLAVAIAVGGGLYQFARWNQERDFKPLFTGLAAEDAGAVTAKLKELGVAQVFGPGTSTRDIVDFVRKWAAEHGLTSG